MKIILFLLIPVLSFGQTRFKDSTFVEDLTRLHSKGGTLIMTNCTVNRLHISGYDAVVLIGVKTNADTAAIRIDAVTYLTMCNVNSGSVAKGDPIIINGVKELTIFGNIFDYSNERELLIECLEVFKKSTISAKLKAEMREKIIAVLKENEP